MDITYQTFRAYYISELKRTDLEKIEEGLLLFCWLYLLPSWLYHAQPAVPFLEGCNEVSRAADGVCKS